MVCFGVCAVQQICHNLALHRAIPQQRGEKVLAGLPKMRFSARDGLWGINACVDLARLQIDCSICSFDCFRHNFTVLSDTLCACL